MSRLEDSVTIDDLRRLALRRLPAFIGDYLEQGAGDGAGVARNIAAFRNFRFIPRALVDVTDVDTRVELFGRTYASCFGISAVGMAGICRRHADELLAEAARDADLPFILSGGSTASVEAIARIAPDHTWYQLYAAKTPTLTEHMIGRARDAGVSVLVFTVDNPVQQRSEVVSRTGLSIARGPSPATLPRLVYDACRHPRWASDYVFSGGMPKLDSWAVYAPPGSGAGTINTFVSENHPSNQVWPDLERIRRLWDGPLIVKGLVHAEDVLRAGEAGADAVTISNHGGNKLDCMPSAIEALAGLGSSRTCRTPLLFDGGIRRGSDILVSRGLGAAYFMDGPPLTTRRSLASDQRRGP